MNCFLTGTRDRKVRECTVWTVMYMGKRAFEALNQLWMNQPSHERGKKAKAIQSS